MKESVRHFFFLENILYTSNSDVYTFKQRGKRE